MADLGGTYFAFIILILHNTNILILLRFLEDFCISWIRQYSHHPSWPEETNIDGRNDLASLIFRLKMLTLLPSGLWESCVIGGSFLCSADLCPSQSHWRIPSAVSHAYPGWQPPPAYHMFPSVVLTQPLGGCSWGELVVVCSGLLPSIISAQGWVVRSGGDIHNVDVYLGSSYKKMMHSSEREMSRTGNGHLALGRPPMGSGDEIRRRDWNQITVIIPVITYRWMKWVCHLTGSSTPLVLQFIIK